MFFKIVIIISIGCGLVSAYRYAREKRYLESLIVLAFYFFPPLIFFWAITPITSLIQHLPIREGIDEKMIDGCSMFILSPILFFWALWILYGGYALINDDIDLMGYLRGHFRGRNIQIKILGLFLMGIGLVLFFLSFAYLGPGIWILPFFMVSFLMYFGGAIIMASPDDIGIVELINRKKTNILK